MTTMSPSDRLTAAEAGHAQVVARLAAARVACDDVRAALAKERESYLMAGAAAELDDRARPSRDRLTALEQQLADAKDLVDVLERPVAEAARQMRHARAEVLDDQALAVRAETRERQGRINELQPQIEAMQSEIMEHACWIRNEGPVRAARLAAEAAQLKRS